MTLLKESKLPSGPTEATWKEMLPNYLPCAVLAGGVVCEYYWGNWFLLVWLVYVILSILDHVLPVDNSNIAEGRKRIVEKDKRFLIPLYICWTLDIGILFWLLHRISNGTTCLTIGSWILQLVVSA